MQTNYWDLKEGHGNKVVNMLIKFYAEVVNKLPLNLLSSNGEESGRWMWQIMGKKVQHSCCQNCNSEYANTFGS